ncbi:MAG: SDR family NAD(P)-dependent oxidoreductase [Gammaproteobacteria bacterium]|nr:SDR family NAD(P)-dependent oxidoreductase [Gammaproteobacteria bacterium]
MNSPADESSTARPRSRHGPSGERGAVGESIAVVGMACRFPGAADLSAFWQLLEAGGNTVSHGSPGPGSGRVSQMFPDETPVHPASRYGSFLEGIDQFDAEFFRISPLEAESLDPQQRLLLEVSWEALEDAGIAPASLDGSRTGVYAGIGSYEYQELVRGASNPVGGDATLYLLTGNRFSTASGRVSFFLGLQGASVAVDTACSSSLVAVHQAVAGLERGEADLALAGGVCVILSPLTTEGMASAGMLSPSGQCWTFDERADGFVRSEGCGILVLKRLEEAEAAGDRIWGVIRGAAINQDGARPGLSVPMRLTQERVIEDALSRASVAPSEVDYLEAHGTGTKLGDPVEIAAAASVYGRGRDSETPLLVGSVKTNIGHLAAAAGSAGLIKVLLAMRRGVIPRHLNLSNPNPNIEWERLPVRITTTPTEWPNPGDRPPLAGVSSFGFSGTNSHVIVEGHGAPDAPATGAGWPVGTAREVPLLLPEAMADQASAVDAPKERRLRILPLSGKSPEAVQDLAARYKSWLEQGIPNDDGGGTEASKLADMAWTAAVGRDHFAHRAAVVFSDAASLCQGLDSIVAGERGAAPAAVSKIAFAFTGQASQWTGMGYDLYEREPVVRAVLDHCDAIIRDDRGASLLDVMFGLPGATGELDDPQWKQPAIYALECALTALWSSIGVRPEIVLGHSLGEIAAAYTAGVLSLEDGLRFAAARGALIGALPGDGAMAAVFASPSQVAAALDDYNASCTGIGLAIAADNGAQQVVSGPREDVEALAARLEAQDVRVVPLRKSPAYHSAMVEPALDDLEAALQALDFSSPSLTFVSNLTGAVATPDKPLDAAYWRRQARDPVEFRACVETTAELGVDAIVEVGPHAVIGPMASSAWPQGSGSLEPFTVASLRRPSDETPEAPGEGTFVHAVAAAYEAGLPLRFEGLFAGEARCRIALPTYPFQRRRHWIGAPKRRRSDAGHPLLGARHDSPHGDLVFASEVGASDPDWLDDHRVFDQVVVPGAMFGAMAAGVLWSEGARSVTLEECQLHSPMILPIEQAEAEASPREAGRELQLLCDGPKTEPPRRFEVFSKGATDDWTQHMDGRMLPGLPPDAAPARVDLDAVRADLTRGDVASLYRNKISTKVVLGPAFRPLQTICYGPGEAIGDVVLQEELRQGGMDMHPILLDGCFQVLMAARGQARRSGKTTYMPFGWERLWLVGPPPQHVVCHARMRGSGVSVEDEWDDSAEVLKADLRIYTPDGEPIGGVDGFTMKRATRTAMLAAMTEVGDLLYEVAWRERVHAQGPEPARLDADSATDAARIEPFSDYLQAEGVTSAQRLELLADLDRLSRAYAVAAFTQLDCLRDAGTAFEPQTLADELGIGAEHRRLFARLLAMLGEAGVVVPGTDGKLAVAAGRGGSLPDDALGDPQQLAADLEALHPHGAYEIGLLRRCGEALVEVLQGKADPLTLLFSSGEPSAADIYRNSCAARAGNRLLADTLLPVCETIPEGSTLRVLEVGAGTGSATEAVLSVLPEGRFDYLYTDVSAAFFAPAEGRFGGEGSSFDFRVLDIEADPSTQGFDRQGYDLVVASNVLHATRDLKETLANCRSLLAPGGRLVVLELMRARHWQDLTFGLLDGWWRFADSYRPASAIAEPEVWRQAVRDAGFSEVTILGVEEDNPDALLDRGIVVASAPDEAAPSSGIWLIVRDRGGVGDTLASELAARNQAVVVAGEGVAEGAKPPSPLEVVQTSVPLQCRESWKSLLEGLAPDAVLEGIVHLPALDGHGREAATGEIAQDVKHAQASALALVQGALDADVTFAKGLWLVTRGAQVLDRERDGTPAGAALWGFGKVVAREAAQLNPRMIDIDPDDPTDVAVLAGEMLWPDGENHIAWRGERRRVARLVQAGAAAPRTSFPVDRGWRLTPGTEESLDALGLESVPERSLEPGEVRIAVDAAGLNFRDVLRAMGALETGELGRELCGRVVATGENVSHVSVGDRVVGMAFGAFAAEVTTRAELVVPAPSGISSVALAGVPTAFVSAALSLELAGLTSGERVLIHSGAGGVGLAAIQLAQAAGARIFATCSAPKQDFLRSLAIKGVYDSRTVAFAQAVLEATDGAGVDVVLNSLTGEGFVDASLSCLARGGRFVELGAREIWSEEAMAAARPDVRYSVLRLDEIKERDPAGAGAVLADLTKRMEAGELAPLPLQRWPMAEVSSAMTFMRRAQHIGKIVLTQPSIAQGRLRGDGTYLVTGGFGGIGCVLAGWLADHGAGTIVLNGRRPPDAVALETIQSLESRGVVVRSEIADVSVAQEVDAMLDRIDAELPPLAGIVHSAGVLADASLGNQTWDTFETVMGPKVQGAWNLHRATVHRDLDLFVLFSSAAGVMGNPGQSNHAAANSFLDQLAAHRRALGLSGQAIAWGAWAEIGKAEEHRERIAEHLAARGIRWITPRQGLDVFERVVREDVGLTVSMAADWPVYAKALGRPSPLLEELLSFASEEPRPASEAPQGQDDLVMRLRNAPLSEHHGILCNFVLDALQSIMRLPGRPAPSARFTDLGMDSLMAVELRNRLNRAFAGAYVATNTVVFDYPDADALSRFLIGELAATLDVEGKSGTVADAAEPVVQARTHDRTGDEAIAIVGMACRYPGAPDVAAYWNRLASADDLISDGRPDFESWSHIVGDAGADQSSLRRGGFVSELDCFDAGFFGIRPIEAEAMDPQQRMLLETSWHALEDAAIDTARLRGTRAGVYVGLGAGEYRELIGAAGRQGGYFGTMGSIAVGRIAFEFGLVGPAIPLELNCASSLVAVHEAVTALQRGEVELALAGGVNVVLSPGVANFLIEHGMLSSVGRCASFDASADGYVRGEGCGVVVLKRHADALSGGDRIWGVIRGSAVNQNGTGAGLTIPNGPAQQQVMEDALRRSGVAPSDVDYVEANGVGSQLGDPIEVQATAAVYGKARDKEQPLLLGAVKSNIGHLEAAAGIAGLIKVVLSMRRGAIPKQLHFETPNPHVDWDRVAIRVPSQPTDWPRKGDGIARAGVSAFGFSGTNAHVIVEAPTDGAESGNGLTPEGGATPVGADLPDALGDGEAFGTDYRARPARLLPLSAKSDNALRALARRYVAWIDEQRGGLETDEALAAWIADLTWTAGSGRSHFGHRAAIVFTDLESLHERLRELSGPDGAAPTLQASKVAFVFSDEVDFCPTTVERLYQSEPVVRATLDQCDALVRETRGQSLLDLLFGHGGSADAGDPALARSSVYALQCAHGLQCALTYALQCALTALWSSVGIRPGVVAGHEAGELAAAQAAGVFDLEEGLRLALAGCDTSTAETEDVVFKRPAVTMVNAATGGVSSSGDAFDESSWRSGMAKSAAPEAWAKTLADQEVDAIVDLGPSNSIAAAVADVWPDAGSDASARSGSPPLRLSSMELLSCDLGFVDAVASAYTAGLPVSFAGLFAGETRRRVALPIYPFERARHWVEPRKR